MSIESLLKEIADIIIRHNGDDTETKILSLIDANKEVSESLISHLHTLMWYIQNDFYKTKCEKTHSIIIALAKIINFCSREIEYFLNVDSLVACSGFTFDDESIMNDFRQHYADLLKKDGAVYSNSAARFNIIIDFHHVYLLEKHEIMYHIDGEKIIRGRHNSFDLID